jgi:hypothetical protein
MSGELSEAMPDTIHFRRLRGSMSRLFGALRADLDFVDSGSLDVLAYCGDDFSVSATGEWSLAGPVDVPS